MPGFWPALIPINNKNIKKKSDNKAKTIFLGAVTELVK